MYLGSFEDKEDVINQFAIDEKELEGAKILFAEYEQDGYDGSAFVLFTRNGKLYEVNGSHCSCFGLEGQWEPEETLVAAIDRRMIDEQLRGVLKRWERKNRKV